MKKGLYLLILIFGYVISLPADEDYHLKIGDRLTLTVYGEPATKRVVEVDPTGKFSYLFVNSYPAYGKTISDVQRDFEKEMGSYYRDPMVLVSLVDTTGNFYAIMGEVNDPGTKPLVGGSTVLSAIGNARGLKTRFMREHVQETVDFDHAFIARNGEYIPVDFRRLVHYGDLTQNVALKAGDYIYLPSAEIKEVFVLGEVACPTTLEYMDTMSLAEALAEAGGVSLRASSRAIVIRGSLACPTRYLVDVNRLLKGYACNFPLEPGDIVYVPPMRFSAVKDIFYGAIAAFVSEVACVGGSWAFFNLHPHAQDSEIVFIPDAP